MTITNAPTAVSGPLVLADISGYTAFLQSVATAHADDAFADGAVPEAYGILTRLLDGIVSGLVPPFTLSKLEGDAVFAFATDLDVVRGDDVLVCFAQRLPDRLLCDLVEHDAADFDFRLEELLEMPAYRLAFPIRVGRENQLRRVLHRGLEGRDVFLLVRGDDIVRREVPVSVDTHAAPRLALDLRRHFGGGLGQIANVTVARLDPVLVTEEAGQGSGFGGRLDYD